MTRVEGFSSHCIDKPVKLYIYKIIKIVETLQSNGTALPGGDRVGKALFSPFSSQ